MSICTTIWDAGCAGKCGWGEDDTEVAGKDACVLGAVSLKRECSQLFVLYWNIAGPGRGTPRRRASQSLNR